MHVDRLVKHADHESHSLRRADALKAIAFSVEGDPSLLGRVVPALVRALLHGYGWRIDRLIRTTAEVVQRAMPEALDALLAHHSDGREKRKFVATLGRNQA